MAVTREVALREMEASRLARTKRKPRGLPPMQEQPVRVPNRLLGVEINEHGEAI